MAEQGIKTKDVFLQSQSFEQWAIQPLMICEKNKLLVLPNIFSYLKK